MDAATPWDKVVEGVQHCAPVQGETSDFTWVIYPDVMESCDEYLEGGEDATELGRGGLGLTILHRGDIEGVTNPGGEYYFCGDGPYPGHLGRWIGGLGHELGHTLGLPHPPGCDEGLPTCDFPALMAYGFETYPDTYLRADDKEILIRSPFFEGEPTYDRDSLDTLSQPTIRGWCWDQTENVRKGCGSR